MTICVLGKNLTALLVSKILVNKGLNVHIFHRDRKEEKKNSRTIGLSNNSLNFLEKEKIFTKKNCWPIKKIDLYKGRETKKFLSFNPNNNCFFIIYYTKLYNSLELKLRKNNLVKLYKKKKDDSLKLLNKKYELIINTEANNNLSKKYFNKQIKKDYKSLAYTTIITHSKIANNIAEQYFTIYGPIAFLPISNNKTSVVFSTFDKNMISSKDKIVRLIKEFSKKYNITNINAFEKFPINLSLSRNYYHKNVLSFGDALHKIHPLAGQGFNMTIRDASKLSDIIQEKIDLGLNLGGVLKNFESKRKDNNLLFALGIDFIHEFFKLSNKYDIKYIDKFLNFLDKNSSIKNKLQNVANLGF